ncbi:unnamed protein product, partial [Prorocentrum cordatum]
ERRRCRAWRVGWTSPRYPNTQKAMAHSWASDAPDGAPMKLKVPAGLTEAPPRRRAVRLGADTPDPPPIVEWVEELVDDAAAWQPSAGAETPVKQRPGGIDCERLSCKLSQLQAAPPDGAWLGTPSLAEPATVDCTRLSREMDEQQARPMTVSIGTVGHPLSCAAPCEHASLPAGCPHGHLCKKCHLCGASGARAACSDGGAAGDRASLQCPPAVEPSVGSRGHPACCAAPCKYRKRRGGCRNGAACPECHLCHWRRQPLEARRGPGSAGDGAGEREPAEAQAAPAAVQRADGSQLHGAAGQAAASKESPLASELPGSLFWSRPPRPETDSECPSLGSIGHPLCCGPPCKYFNKTGGCKDGHSCVRCHLCQWHRYQARHISGASPWGHGPRTSRPVPRDRSFIPSCFLAAPLPPLPP